MHTGNRSGERPNSSKAYMLYSYLRQAFDGIGTCQNACSMQKQRMCYGLGARVVSLLDAANGIVEPKLMNTVTLQMKNYGTLHLRCSLGCTVVRTSKLCMLKKDELGQGTEGDKV